MGRLAYQTFVTAARDFVKTVLCLQDDKSLCFQNFLNDSYIALFSSLTKVYLSIEILPPQNNDAVIIIFCDINWSASWEFCRYSEK